MRAEEPRETVLNLQGVLFFILKGDSNDKIAEYNNDNILVEYPDEQASLFFFFF